MKSSFPSRSVVGEVKGCGWLRNAVEQHEACGQRGGPQQQQQKEEEELLKDDERNVFCRRNPNAPYMADNNQETTDICHSCRPECNSHPPVTLEKQTNF